MSDHSHSSVSEHEKVKIIDNRKVGAVLLVIAFFFIVLSVVLRIVDVKKGESYEHVDGTVNGIQISKHRKYKVDSTTRTVSVIYVPKEYEEYDMHCFVSGSSTMLDFVHKGDTVRVHYEKGNPDKAYIAEKDWLTGGYIHTGRGYNVLLIIAGGLILFGALFIEDGVKLKKSGINPAWNLEYDPKTKKMYDPALYELTRYANRRRGYKKFWIVGSIFFTIFAGAGVGALVQYFTTEPRDPNLLIAALFSYLIGSGMLILVMITLIRQQKKRRRFVMAFMADEYTARYKEREKAAQTLWKHVSRYMDKESPFSRFKLEYSRDWLEKYKRELKKYL